MQCPGYEMEEEEDLHEDLGRSCAMARFVGAWRPEPRRGARSQPKGEGT